MDNPVEVMVVFVKPIGDGKTRLERRTYGKEFGFTKKQVDSTEFKHNLSFVLKCEFGADVSIRGISAVVERKQNPHNIRLLFCTPTDKDIESIIERVNHELLGKPLNDKTAREARELALKYAADMISVESELTY